MLPRSLECTECSERLHFPTDDRAYYIGSEANPLAVKEQEYLQMILDPIWCFECGAPSWSELVPTIAQLEAAFCLVKTGKVIEFPFDNQYLKIDDSLVLLRKYFNWASNRVSKGKCVICLNCNFTLLGGAPVKLKHEHCEYGVFKPTYTISSYNGPMQTIIHNSEGAEIGKLSYWNEELNGWSFIGKNKKT